MVVSSMLRKSLLLVVVASALAAAPGAMAAPPKESIEGSWQYTLTQVSYTYDGPDAQGVDRPFENPKENAGEFTAECTGDVCTIERSFTLRYQPPGGITFRPDAARGRWMAEYEAGEVPPCTPVFTESVQLVRHGTTISGSVTLHQERTSSTVRPDGQGDCTDTSFGYTVTVNSVLEGTVAGGGGDPGPQSGTEDLAGDWHFVTTHVSTNGGSGAQMDAPQPGETDLTVSCGAGGGGVSAGGDSISYGRIGGLAKGRVAKGRVAKGRVAKGRVAKVLLAQPATSCFLAQGLVDGWPPSGDLSRGADGAWTATYTSDETPSCPGEEPRTYTVTLTRDGDRISGSVVWKYYERIPNFDFNVGNEAVCSDPARSQATSSFSVVGTLRGARGATGFDPEIAPGASDDQVALSFPDADLSGLTPRQLASVGAVVRGDRSVVPAALVTPSEAMSNTKQLVQNGLLAAVLVLLLVFPSQLFNSTWDEHHERVLAALPWLRRPAKVTAVAEAEVAHVAEGAEVAEGADVAEAGDEAPAPSRASGLLARPFVKFLLVAAASAVLGGFLDPAFGLDSASIALVLGVLAALLLGTLVSGGAARTYRRMRDLPAESTWKSVPAGLAIALVCVVVSRAVHFRPGYLYGLVGGIAFAAALDKRDTGRAELTGLAGGIGLALGAWFLFVPVSDAVNDGGAFPLQVADALLASLFIGGIEGALFSLIPVRFLPGHKIAQHSWIGWAAAAGIAAFLFVHVLLRPESGYLGTSSTASVAVTYGLFGVFGLASVAFWGWFRTHPDPPAPAAP
jgi:hypothetical protein